MTGQHREFAVGDRVIRRYAAAKYGVGTVFEIVPHYRIEWDNGFEPAVYSPEALDPAPRPPLAVGDTFTAADPRADDLPVGTVVLDDADLEVDAWICRGRGEWVYTGRAETGPLFGPYTYTIIHLPEVVS